MMHWVCFDVGETIFDETGLWGRWADWLGVPREDFISQLRKMIVAGRHHREVFEVFRPGLDLDAAQTARMAAGDDPGFHVEDMFPDVRSCFEALHDSGFQIGVAGNTSVLTEQAVMRLGLPIDFIASSSRWGVAKPDLLFFERLAEACRTEPRHIAYVGDRLDNDVLAADRSGMTGIFLRRGLWADAHRTSPDAARARFTIDTLGELASSGPMHPGIMRNR